MTELIKVLSAYGRISKVSRVDYEGTKMQLPLYNRNNVRVFDSITYKPGMCATIHRDNIFEVIL